MVENFETSKFVRENAKGQESAVKKETVSERIEGRKDVSEAESLTRYEDELDKLFEGKKPAISFDVFYSAHATAEDMKDLKKYFNKADVFIPELCGWRDEAIKVYKDISAGRMKPEDYLNKRGLSPKKSAYYFYILERFKLIYNSRKPIIFIDPPGGHPIETRRIQAESNLYKPLYPFGEKFETRLKVYKKLLKEFASAQIEREEYMFSQIKPALEKILEENPDFKNKERIKVLLSLGVFHTGIWHMLKKEGRKNNQRVSARFSVSPLVFEFFSEAVRAYRFGKEPDDELITRATMEQELCWLTLLIPTKDSLKQHRCLRKIVSLFGCEEIKGMFEQSRNKDDFASLFKKKLKEKNIEVPDSEEELDKFLKDT